MNWWKRLISAQRNIHKIVLAALALIHRIQFDSHTMEETETQFNSKHYWIKAGLTTFIKGRDSILYYLLYISCFVIFSLGLLTALVGLMVGLTPQILFWGGLNSGDAWQVGVFIGLPTAAFFIFKCAVKLMIWRTFERQVSHSETGRWIRGLPSVLGLELTKDICSVLCLLVIVNSIWLMSSDISGLGILFNALACLVLLFVHLMYPVVLSEQIRNNVNGLTAIYHAIKQVLKFPWRWLILNIIPGVFKGLMCCLILILLMNMNGSGYIWLITAGLGIMGLVTCIEPAFWMIWKD